jgi:hypothetical protein
MTTNEQILATVAEYQAENEKFVQKGVKASAGRARKALAELAKLCKLRRSEIQEAKLALSAEKAQ